MQEKNKNKELIFGTMIYAIGGFGTKILSFLFVPLYTYYILPAEMGTYDLLITTVSLLTPIITIQIGDAAYRWLIGEEGETDKCLQVAYKRLFYHLIILAVIVWVISLFIQYPYMDYFFWILAGSAAFNTVQKLLRGVKNQKLFAGSGIAYTFVFLTMNVLQICVLHKGIEGMFLSSAIAYWIATAVALWGDKRVRFVPSKGFFKVTQLEREMVRYAIPLIPNQLSWWVVNWSDRYIVKTFLGNEWNGIYSISYKFPTVLQSVLTLFNISFHDVSIADKEDEGSYFSEVFNKYSVLVFSVVLMAIPLSKLYVYIFMSEQYKVSADFISFLYLGSAFQSFASYFGASYLKTGNTKGIFTTSMYGAVVNIAVNIALIRFWGLHAAAVSTFLGFLVMWFVRFRHAQKRITVSLDYKRFIGYGVLALGYAFLACRSNVMMDIVMAVTAFLIFLLTNRRYITYMIKRIKR